MSNRMEEVQFDDSGLVPVVVQDDVSGEVLMLAYANREALERTAGTGRAHFFSRSRGELWEKGATSGNFIHVSTMALDCDGDAVMYRGRPEGPACHTGRRSCFWRSLQGTQEPDRPIIGEIADIIADRARNPREGSYVSSLLGSGPEGVLRKIGEEATEVMLSGALNREKLANEVADLWFHTLIALQFCGVDYRDVLSELRRRRR